MSSDEGCWCGSGKLYAECHASRESESPIPLNALAELARRRGEHRVCMHFGASAAACMGKVINAHTVQRSRELRQLIDDDQHVLHFDSNKRDPRTGLLPVSRVGWRDASTFAGFCQKHDAETFSPVETRAFDGASEQCALLAYRSICYEVHRKRSVALANPAIQPFIDRGYTEALQRERQAIHRVGDDGNAAGLDHFQQLKAAIEVALQAGDLSRWRSTILWFSGPLSVASSGVISPNRDLDGLELQNWIGRGSEQESMCLNIVSVEGGGAAVLTWPTEAQAPRRFIERLLQYGEAALSLLVQFSFRHLHNIYFSRTWWESLRSAQKVFICNLASLTSTEAYFAPLDFRSRTRVVPWTLVRVTS